MHDSLTLAERLDQGDATIGVLSTIVHPNLVEVYGSLGLDFVWIDLEHAGPSPYDAERLEDLARAADLAGVEVVLRLPTKDPSLVRKTLDTGVRNILIPRVETAAEVRQTVASAHFSYDGAVGDRGLAGVRANRWGADMDSYTSRSDRHVQVGVMIENERAVANVEEILAVDELGFAFIGPWDLSHSLGHPLEEEHDSVQAAIADIEDACADADVPVMGFVGDSEDAAEKAEAGYQLLVVGSDVDALRSALGDRVEEIARGLGQTRASDYRK
ncbi:aldolase [Halobacterium sp. DL1]|jgi:2-dehydro-3-deoxyglucarate aldolase|nr:aldolase [Halobacterium sp. DL1]